MARIGSTRAARMAGSELANSETASSTTDTITIGREIGGRHLEQLRPQCLARHGRRQQAGENPGQRQAAGLPHDHAQHLSSAGTERHPDADLARALSHRERQHPVEANRRQQHRRRREADDQHGVETRLGDRGGDELFHRADAEHGHVRVQIAKRTRGRRDEGRGLAPGAQHHTDHAHRELRVRQVNRRTRGHGRSQAVHISGNADDRAASPEALSQRGSELHVAANRIAIGPQLRGGRFAEDHDRLGAAGVAGGERRGRA